MGITTRDFVSVLYHEKFYVIDIANNYIGKIYVDGQVYILGLFNIKSVKTAKALQFAVF